MTQQQEDFINALVVPAQKSEIKYGILSSITIAQAILESGWGQSELAQNANNLFGIKKQPEESGMGYVKETKEFIDGAELTIWADFKAYDNWRESVDDHGKFLMKPRYDKVRSATSAYDQAHALQDAGYATAPTYAGELIRLIYTYDLEQYDKPAFCPECGVRIRPCTTCGYVQHEVTHDA